jgi:putative transposase
VEYCVVLDAWSRRVVGWSPDRRPTAAMVNSALGMAIEVRIPVLACPFAASTVARSSPWTFSHRVRAAGLAHSLGSVGDTFDNAVVEPVVAACRSSCSTQMANPNGAVDGDL